MPKPQRRNLAWPQAWRRRRAYFTEDDMRGLADRVGFKLMHDAAAASRILDDASRQFLFAFDMDQQHLPPGEVADKAQEIEKAAGALLRALGLPPHTTSARASGRALADLAWRYASVAPPRSAIERRHGRWHIRRRARPKPRIERAIGGIILLRVFGKRLAEKHKSRRGKKQSQPGLDSFVLLMAAAYKQMFGRSPYPSRPKRPTEFGSYCTGEYAGPFVRFLPAVALMLADRIEAEDSGAAVALTEWAAGDTLPQKADRLKVWRR